MLEFEKNQNNPNHLWSIGNCWKNIKENIKMISKNAAFQVIQKTLLLGTAHIIINVITST